MNQWLRAITIAAGGAAILVVGIVLLRPSPPGPEAPHGRERARASHRVRVRLEQLRVEHPDWRDTVGEIRGQALLPVTPPGGGADSATPPQAQHAPAHGARASAPGAGAELPGAAEQDDIPTIKKMALEDPDPDRRLAAITLLGATDDPEAPTILAQALSDRNEEVRMAALEALSDFTNEPPVDAIEDALHDPSPDIRFEALSVLADVGGERARSAIEQALSDPDEDVRALAEGILDLESLAGPTPGLRQRAK
jgi:hypothetical protein